MPDRQQSDAREVRESSAVVRGAASIAAEIIARADELEIPIHRDPDLLDCLGSLRTADEIPVDAYVAVAEILAFLHAANGADVPSPSTDS